MVDQDAFPELFHPSSRAEPHAIYARMRAAGRLHRLIHPRLDVPIWVAVRYDDCVELLKDPRLIRDFRKLPDEVRRRYFPLSDRTTFMDQHMLDADPPDHTRLRAIVQRAFSPRMMEGLRPRIQAIADGLIDAVIDRRRMELVADFAFPLPTAVIAELLGLPLEDSRPVPPVDQGPPRARERSRVRGARAAGGGGVRARTSGRSPTRAARPRATT